MGGVPPSAHVGGIIGGGNVPPPQQQATGIMALPLGLGTYMSHVAPFAGGTVLPTGNALASAMLGLLPPPQAGIVGMQPLPPPLLPANNDVATQIGLVAGAALGALAAAAHHQQNQQQGQQANSGMANIVQQAVFALQQQQQQQQQQQPLMSANVLPPSGGGGGGAASEGAGIPPPRRIDLSATAGNTYASLSQHQANGAIMPPPSGSAYSQPHAWRGSERCDDE